MTPELIALWALLLGATAAGMTAAVRRVPSINRRVQAEQRPWACDICMCFWTTALLGAGAAVARWDPVLVVCCGPAYPWSLWVLRKITDPIGPPPMLLEDSDDGS